jgi:pimeloyl-ACP methyl ester carboxylesterase
MRHTTAILAAALAMVAVGATAEPIARGEGQQTADLAGTKLMIFTYRPDTCTDPSLLFVFHGLNRNAKNYRDYARPLGDRNCMLIVAPLFDQERFPTWRYQRGGIVDGRTVQAPREWTGNLVVKLVDWVRASERPALEYDLIGHSAGAQFLSRVAAFTPTQAKRIVVANPSTYVAATLDVDAPFGMGRVYDARTAQSQLRRYLGQPVTVFLGEEDTGDENLNESPPAMAQGKTRFERGMNVYRDAEALAASRGWPFNWRLVVLPGTGHSARKMFSSSQALEALKP